MPVLVGIATGSISAAVESQKCCVFIEHGLSDDPKIQVWQNRLTPLQKVIGDGCHLNRNIQALVEAQFEHVSLETFYGKDLPKIGGYLYKGVATKAP